MWWEKYWICSYLQSHALIRKPGFFLDKPCFFFFFSCIYPFWLLRTLHISFNPHDNSIRYLPLFIPILQMRGWVLGWLSHMFMFSKLGGSRERIWNSSPSDLRARTPEHCQRVISKSPGRASLPALQGSCYSYFLCSHLIIFPNENASLTEWKEPCFKRKMVSLLLNFWLKIRVFSHLFWSYWSTSHPDSHCCMCFILWLLKKYVWVTEVSSEKPINEKGHSHKTT